MTSKYVSLEIQSRDSRIWSSGEKVSNAESTRLFVLADNEWSNPRKPGMANATIFLIMMVSSIFYQLCKSIFCPRGDEPHDTKFKLYQYFRYALGWSWEWWFESAFIEWGVSQRHLRMGGFLSSSRDQVVCTVHCCAPVCIRGGGGNMQTM